MKCNCNGDYSSRGLCYVTNQTSLAPELMGDIVVWSEMNYWWETDLQKTEETHSFDSQFHNGELCCAKPADLTAGFV